jgi:hypothetical protein
MSYFAFLIVLPVAFFEALAAGPQSIARTRNEALMCPFAGAKPAVWFTNLLQISRNAH